MALARASFRKLYSERLPYIEEIIYNAYEEVPEKYSSVMNVKTSSRMKETDLMIADYGLFDEFGEGAPIVVDEIMQSYTKDFLHVDYGKACAVTKRALRDDQDGIMNERAAGLGFAARQTVEQLAFNEICNNAFTTATSADGAAIYASHQLTKGGTFDNSTSSDLDQGALEEALTNFADLKDEANKQINLQPAILCVGTALEGRAMRLLNSMQLPGTDQNDVNDYIRSRNLTLIVSPYLSSTTSWFVFATPGRCKYKFYWRQKAEVESDVDIMTKTGVTTMDFSCSMGVSDWRGGFGASGS